MFGRLLKRLASARIAVVLIIVLMVLSVLNVLLPQKTYFTSADFAAFQSQAPGLARVLAVLGLDAVFGGWILTVVTLALCLNVAACTWLRVSRRASSSARVPVRVESMGLPPESAARARDTIEAAHDRLADEAWHVTDVSGGFAATKRATGFWGSVLLHVSLLVIAVGGVAVMMSSFTGTMLLAEGQSVVDASDAYLSVTRSPRVGDAFTGAEIRMGDMAITYDRGLIVDAHAAMSGVTTSGRTVERIVSVNHPLDIAGKSYLLQDTGLSADVVLGLNGEPQSLVVNLAERTDRGYADVLEVPLADGGTIRVKLELTPVPLAPGEQLDGGALDVRDPRLEVTVIDDRAATVPDIALLPGESVELVPDLTLSFTGTRYWSTFLVRSEPGRSIVYIGFVMAVIGSFWRFVSADRQIGLRIVPGTEGSSKVLVAYGARPWGMDYARDRAHARRLGQDAVGGVQE